MLKSGHRPYAFTMLIDGLRALEHNGLASLTSIAQLPLTTLVGVYFCKLVSQDCLADPKFLAAARDAACATMDENLAILPRLIADRSVTDEEAKIFRNTTAEMTAWARACTEPLSLGAIHIFARVHWHHWYVRIIASNSSLLQVFLYLCEKRRLEAPETECAAGGGGDEDNYGKRLLGALMEDPRVAPFMLRGGRPKTVVECIQALQKWCHVPTTNGETQERLGNLAEKSARRQELIVRGVQARTTDFLCEAIVDNQCGLTKDMHACPRVGEGGDRQ